jgi:hypothetical protein
MTSIIVSTNVVFDLLVPIAISTTKYPVLDSFKRQVLRTPCDCVLTGSLNDVIGYALAFDVVLTFSRMSLVLMSFLFPECSFLECSFLECLRHSFLSQSVLILRPELPVSWILVLRALHRYLP